MRDNIEIGLKKDGSLDEIWLWDNTRCLFHMEKMDDHWFWMRLYGITQDLVVHISAGIEEVMVRHVDHAEALPVPKITAHYEWDDPPKESETDSETPVAERRAEVGNLVNKYGVSVLLEEVAEIVKAGRMAEHEQRLVNDLLRTKESFMSNEKEFFLKES